MTSHDREHLHRIAYGPDATAAERLAAESALRRLDEADRVAVAGVQQVLGEEPTQPETSVEPENDEGVEEGESAPSLWNRSIRVAWLIPIVVGSLAVGYAASIGPWGALRNTQSPNNSASPTPSAEPTEAPERSPQSGDLAAADSWFDRAYKETDTFPKADALEYYGIVPEDVRIAVNGGDKGSVWVARAEGTLCLIVADPVEGASASSCTERDRFAESGLAISSMCLRASWYGGEVTATPPLVPVATTPPPPTSGPGDLAASNLWFVMPALPSDEYPEPDLLAGLHLDQGDVRRVIPESTPWIKLWLAKQSTGGFCFLSFDDADPPRGAACVPTEEFQKRGLTTSTQGYSFYWDGTTVSVTGQ